MIISKKPGLYLPLFTGLLAALLLTACDDDSSTAATSTVIVHNKPHTVSK